MEFDAGLVNRSLNEGFSGGEKKRNEIFQLAMLEPRLSILDETDSGLDIDALRIVASGVNKLRSRDNAFIIITHYQRLLDYIVPDFVHVLYDGRIVRSGTKELALELEEKGYDWLKEGWPPWLRTLYDHLVAVCPRDARSFSAFREHGFPTIREEDWRFTNLAPFLKDEYGLSVAAPDASVVRELLRSCTVDGWDAARIVFVNGVLQESLSDVPSSGALSDVLVDTTAYRLAGLNAALSTGVCFKVGRANKPIHLIHLYTADVPAFFQPRVRFVLPGLAELTLLESSLCATGVAPVMVNALLECVLEEGARLTHYVLQSGRKGERLLSHTQVVQARDSVYDNVTLNLPEADLIRNQLNVTLDGTAGSECHLYGLYLPADNQLIDNHTVVDHRQPNCESNELYKGVLRGNARAVFNGKIFVRREAQKTNAFQKNNNRQLGDKAHVHSKPQLEIFADDVKCSHGSTIGQFNPESLFYLRARGIGEEIGKKELLVQAFGADISRESWSPPQRWQRHLEKHLHRERPIIHRYDVPKHVEHI